jgi:hypothetical protein
MKPNTGSMTRSIRARRREKGRNREWEKGRKREGRRRGKEGRGNGQAGAR